MLLPSLYQTRDPLDTDATINQSVERIWGGNVHVSKIWVGAGVAVVTEVANSHLSSRWGTHGWSLARLAWILSKRTDGRHKTSQSRWATACQQEAADEVAVPRKKGSVSGSSQQLVLSEGKI